MDEDELYYLDLDTIEIINESFCGPGAGIRDRSGVEGIAGRPSSSFGGHIFFPSVFDKAAALLHGFATTQYFSDGNKRTSFLTATVFLESNGFEWIGPGVDEAEGFLLEVAANKHDTATVARWLEQYSTRRMT